MFRSYTCTDVIVKYTHHQPMAMGSIMVFRSYTQFQWSIRTFLVPSYLSVCIIQSQRL